MQFYLAKKSLVDAILNINLDHMTFAVLIFLIGLYPTPMLNVMDASVNYLVNQMENAPALQLSEGVAPVIRESIGH